jgi:hypothetical protein
MIPCLDSPSPVVTVWRSRTSLSGRSNPMTKPLIVVSTLLTILIVGPGYGQQISAAHLVLSRGDSIDVLGGEPIPCDSTGLISLEMTATSNLFDPQSGQYTIQDPIVYWRVAGAEEANGYEHSLRHGDSAWRHSTDASGVTVVSFDRDTGSAVLAVLLPIGKRDASRLGDAFPLLPVGLGSIELAFGWSGTVDYDLDSDTLTGVVQQYYLPYNSPDEDVRLIMTNRRVFVEHNGGLPTAVHAVSVGALSSVGPVTLLVGTSAPEIARTSVPAVTVEAGESVDVFVEHLSYGEFQLKTTLPSGQVMLSPILRVVPPSKEYEDSTGTGGGGAEGGDLDPVPKKKCQKATAMRPNSLGKWWQSLAACGYPCSHPGSDKCRLPYGESAPIVDDGYCEGAAPTTCHLRDDMMTMGEVFKLVIAKCTRAGCLMVHKSGQEVSYWEEQPWCIFQVVPDEPPVEVAVVDCFDF